jgi:undecaprenyl-diphosphatase
MVRASPMSQDVAADQTSVPNAATRPWWPMPRRDAHGRERVRRPGDGVLLFFAAALFVILIVRSTDVSVIGANIFMLVHALPEGLHGIFVFLYGLGTLWIVTVVAVVALLRRNVLLAVTVAISGLVAAAAAHLLEAWLDTEHTISLPSDLAAAGATSSFPLARVAIATAVATAATPYVIRPIRIGTWVAAGLVGLAGIYLAEGLPGDALGGAVLGFAVTRAVFLALGAPAGRPTAAQVREALTLLGIEAVDVAESDEPFTGAVEMLAVTADGRHLVARVLGRDQRDASILAKSWRWIMQKDFQPNLFVTRVNEVEHEAYVTLMAQRAGAGVPDVVVAGTAGPDAAMLVEAYPPGRPLHRLGPDDVSPDLIADLWLTLARLRGAGIAHGHPSADRFIVAAHGGVCLTDFSAAVAGAPRESLHRDVAELLVATAVIVGPERAADAAVAAVGADALRAALPFVQPVVISRSTRHAIGKHSKLLDEVRGCRRRARSGPPSPGWRSHPDARSRSSARG